MNSLFNEYHELLEPRGGPCLSLYQPTHRHHPDKDQDPIRFRGLVKAIRNKAIQKHSSEDVGRLLAPFHALSDNREFWNHPLDGLAVFSAPGMFRFYRLQRTVKELVVVADSFHTKPLMRIIQSFDSYQILGVSRRDIKLFEGNRYAVDGVDLDERVPRTIADALGEELTASHLVIASGATGVGHAPIRQGSGTKSDEVDRDTERFFRVVDRAVLEHHSRPSGLPLILAALPEHQALFRRVSHNPLLIPQAIDMHPDALSGDQLRDHAWRLIQPYYLQRLQTLIDKFEAGSARGAADKELARVAGSAAERRIATLLIDADRHIPGRLDSLTGSIELGDAGDPLMDDVLDDLAELVLAGGGEVVVVPADRMPVGTGAAAIHRY